MKFTPENIEAVNNVLTVAASVAASVMLIRSIQVIVSTQISNLSHLFSSQTTVIIEEFGEESVNQMFDAANTYLCEKLSRETERIKVNKQENEKEMAVTIDLNQCLVDTFQDVKFNWILVCERNGKAISDSSMRSDRRYFELSCKKKDRDMVLTSYLPHVLQRARDIRKARNAVKFHTIDYNCTYYWSSINLDHPSTFETIAMDGDMKALLIKDLERFIGRKEYYKKVGKTWKRGYLFYGPCGTGKSSLVAAMANHLKFDIYDLDLREVHSNSDLRRLLIGIGNRSILLIEDLRYSTESQNGELESCDDSRITLSDVLNVFDGLWSSCGGERIVVITSTDKNNLDPALLKAGHMDLLIEMSHCTYSGFKILAKNYLNIEAHPQFEKIKELLDVIFVTPAEVAGELMNYDTADIALSGLIELLKKKKSITLDKD